MLGGRAIEQHLPPSVTDSPVVDYLAVGALTIDRLAKGQTAGGSVAYASVAAVRLGLKAGIVTAAGDEMDWPAYLPHVAIVRQPTSRTATFENRYEGGCRVQRLLAAAPAVPVEAVPEGWRGCPIVHLAPVAHEIGGEFPGLFPHSLIGLTPQGLLREWGPRGQVRQGRWTGDDRLLGGANVVILSEEDLAGDSKFLSQCLDRVSVTLLTRGARGVTLFAGGQERHFPALPVAEVDPTGAGDVFAAAFLVEYQRTGDPCRSAAFASCAASFAVEQPGIAGVADRAAVEQRLGVYLQQQ